MGALFATEERRAADEAEVASALRRLPEGWHAFHDVPWPGRPGIRIDHVVIGPAGVFVVEAESWDGRIEVRDDVLLQDGVSREQAVDLAARAAIAVQRLVPGRCFPVICFAGAPLSGWARDVLVCSSPTIQLKLLSLPHRLGPDDVRRCVQALEHPAGHSPRRAKGLRGRSEAKAPRTSEVRRPLLVVAMMELVLALALVFGGSVQEAADWVTRSYVSVTGDDPTDKPSKIRRDGQPRQQGAGKQDVSRGR